MALAIAPVAVEYVSALQFKQLLEPVTDLYCPGWHAVQVPPFGPVKPSLQTQLVKAVDPRPDSVLDGQL